jgi:hypothetical protein
MSAEYMKKPCAHCPFRRDVKPFLRPERGEELAYLAQNYYSSFPCHKTTVSNDDSDEGEMMCVETTKECAGFLTLMHNELDKTGYDDFVPSPDVVYDTVYDMIDAYEDARG